MSRVFLQRCLHGMRTTSYHCRPRASGSSVALHFSAQSRWSIATLTPRQVPVRSQASASAPSDGGSSKYAPRTSAWQAAINFCPACGAATQQRVPEGESFPRAVCSGCGRVHYLNPKMVVACIVEHEGKVLLCRRKIEPRYGFWCARGPPPCSRRDRGIAGRADIADRDASVTSVVMNAARSGSFKGAFEHCSCSTPPDGGMSLSPSGRLPRVQ